ncbi:MAG: GGDEF domain-containing protein [Abditibacteriota bacterium]|nr:GGDEF domain-containing protein [Abditibacteriota bacterium]
MKELQLSRYIRSYLPYIVAACLLLTFLVYLFLSSSQTYEASAVIKYEYRGAVNGKAPDGSNLDVSEVKTSAILTKVIDKLKLNNSMYSTDSLISRIKTQDILDKDEEQLKQAMLEEGEKYEPKPDTVIVSFSATNSEGPQFARAVLDEVLNTYFSEFGKKYLNVGAFTNPISKINDSNYDYIEMMDIINSSTSDTIKSLWARAEGENSFRSSATGYSFGDLANRFSFIQETKIASLYSRILEYQITKNKKILQSNYSERMTQNRITAQVQQKSISDLFKLIDDYRKQMMGSIKAAELTDPLYDHGTSKKTTNIDDTEEWTWEVADHTVTYDKHLTSWRDASEIKSNAMTDIDYYKYLMQHFVACKGLCGGDKLCAGTGKTCSDIGNPDYEKEREKVEKDLKVLVDELDGLFDAVEKTNDEYNEFLGQSNISTLSTVSVTEGLNIPMYMTIAFFFLVIVCCGSAILIGRMNDIISYAFFTDHLTGFNNRQSLDNFLTSNGRKVLDDGTVCVVVTIKNQVEINKALGRESGDNLIKYFADLLKELFAQSDTFKVYNGSSQFFIFVNRTDYITVEYLLQRFSLLLDNRDKFTGVDIHYSVGMSETSRNEIRAIRALLSKAVTRQAEHTAAAVKEDKQ